MVIVTLPQYPYKRLIYPFDWLDIPVITPQSGG